MPVTPLPRPLGAPGKCGWIWTFPMTCPIQSLLPWFFFPVVFFPRMPQTVPQLLGGVESVTNSPIPERPQSGHETIHKGIWKQKDLFLRVTLTFSSSPVCLCQQRWSLGPPYYCRHLIVQWWRWPRRADLIVYIWGHILRLLHLW